jgi:hypothetical protein
MIGEQREDEIVDAGRRRDVLSEATSLLHAFRPVDDEDERPVARRRSWFQKYAWVAVMAAIALALIGYYGYAALAFAAAIFNAVQVFRNPRRSPVTFDRHLHRHRFGRL